MGLASEFKEFAMKGNVVDLAVGVIIGAAFGKIVSSLVADIFMPTLGKVIGGVNFADLAVNLGMDPAGKAVLIKYGAFFQTIFPKAAPMITPTAKSTTLPFIANSLNSAPIPTAISFFIPPMSLSSSY